MGTVYLVQRGNEWLPDIFSKWDDAYARFMRTVERWRADGRLVNITDGGTYRLAYIVGGANRDNVRLFGQYVKE